MKYLMARDAGVKAAEYVIQQWPELFPSRDFSPVCLKLLLKILYTYLSCFRTLDQVNIWNKKRMKMLCSVCVCVLYKMYFTFLIF